MMSSPEMGMDSDPSFALGANEAYWEYLFLMAFGDAKFPVDEVLDVPVGELACWAVGNTLLNTQRIQDNFEPFDHHRAYLGLISRLDREVIDPTNPDSMPDFMGVFREHIKAGVDARDKKL